MKANKEEGRGGGGRREQHRDTSCLVRAGGVGRQDEERSGRGGAGDRHAIQGLKAREW